MMRSPVRASTDSAVPYRAWVVSFGSGFATIDGKHNADAYVRAVR